MAWLLLIGGALLLVSGIYGLCNPGALADKKTGKIPSRTSMLSMLALAAMLTVGGIVMLPDETAKSSTPSTPELKPSMGAPLYTWEKTLEDKLKRLETPFKKMRASSDDCAPWCHSLYSIGDGEWDGFFISWNVRHKAGQIHEIDMQGGINSKPESSVKLIYILHAFIQSLAPNASQAEISGKADLLLAGAVKNAEQVQEQVIDGVRYSATFNKKTGFSIKVTGEKGQ